MKQYETRGNPADADCLVGHSFGSSVSECSVNNQLGNLMLSLADARPLIADRTLVNAIPEGDNRMAHIVEGPATNMKAQGVGTWGTWLEARRYMEEHELSKPLVIAQAYHLPRVVKQGAKLGIISIVPENLPTDFDKESNQPWTRSPYLWIPFNALGSLLLKSRGQL
jgi:hypothetical protein